MCMKKYPFNCWDTLKIIKLKRNNEISVSVNVVKTEKIDYMCHG